MTVFILISGDGADGNERDIVGVYASESAAEAVRQTYGKQYQGNLFIEEYPVQDGAASPAVLS